MGRKATFEIDPQELYYLYNTEGMSTVAIAKQFGLKQPNGAWDAPRIQRLLKKYNFNTRDKSQAQALALETGRLHIQRRAGRGRSTRRLK